LVTAQWRVAPKRAISGSKQSAAIVAKHKGGKAMKWEYRMLGLEILISPEGQKQLDAMGDDGWELVSITHPVNGWFPHLGMAVFKRPKSS
jgi:hypothetical protein